MSPRSEDGAHHGGEGWRWLICLLHWLLDKGAEEARLALEKPFGVVGLAQVEVLVVEVVTHLVEEGTEKSPKCHHLAAFCGAHPHPDDRVLQGVAVVRIQPVQLPAGIGGTDSLDLNAYRSHLELPTDMVDDGLRQAFHTTVVLGGEGIL